jgi:hypothetical protein
LVGGEVALLDAAEPSTTMTGTDITTRVIALQNEHIGHEVGRPQDAKRGTSGKTVTSTGAMIEDFSESTTPTLAQQALRNPDYEPWTHTEAQVLLT